MTALRDVPGAPASWPFAPIEELDLYLETACEPSLVVLETHTRGHLDRAALEAALTAVLAADPSARRHLAATSRWSRRLRWETAPAIRPGSEVAHHNQLEQPRPAGRAAGTAVRLADVPERHRGAAAPGGGT